MKHDYLTDEINKEGKKAFLFKILKIFFGAGSLLSLFVFGLLGMLSRLAIIVVSLFVLAVLCLLLERRSVKEIEKLAEYRYNSAQRMAEYEKAHRSSHPVTTKRRDVQSSDCETAEPALKENIDGNISVLDQGKAFAKEIDKANRLIPDESVTQNLNVICRYVKDIFVLASKNKDVERQMRKFANIYLPQTLKLCNLYIDLDAKEIQTVEVCRMKDQIAESIANAKEAFSNFNDNLIQ